MRFQAPRGTEDALPGDIHRWQFVESEFRTLAQLYGYREIRTPSFEDTDLFIRSSGETSEVVSKQMYSFTDKGGRPITFRPEGTAPIMRAVIEHSLCPPGTVQRLSYIIPIYRYERPQKGRLREAHQVGLELIGSPSMIADAEIIEMTIGFYRAIGLANVIAMVNSIGRTECRARFCEAIVHSIQGWLKDQDEEGKARALKNPMRLLDSKDPAIQEAVKSVPPVLNFLEEDEKAKFDELQSLLTEAGVPFRVAPEIVRGLDYYTGAVFEVQSTSLGAQSALCGGGRYDGLVKELGGQDTPSVGVAMGIERALIVMEAEGVAVQQKDPDVFVVSAGPEFAGHARRIARTLRSQGCSVLIDPDGKSMKSQLKQADKSGVRWAVILGEDEAAKSAVTLRSLATGEQEMVAETALVERLASQATPGREGRRTS